LKGKSTRAGGHHEKPCMGQGETKKACTPRGKGKASYFEIAQKRGGRFFFPLKGGGKRGEKKGGERESGGPSSFLLLPSFLPRRPGGGKKKGRKGKAFPSSIRPRGIPGKGRREKGEKDIRSTTFRRPSASRHRAKGEKKKRNWSNLCGNSNVILQPVIAEQEGKKKKREGSRPFHHCLCPRPEG